MNKANILRSSEFHMSEGDILHYVIILDAGVSPTVSLVSTGAIANSDEVPDAVVALEASDITSSAFTANWHLIENAAEYYLDVSTDIAFGSFVAGYNNLSVGFVKEYDVVGLDDAITYYYRVRGANDHGSGDSSNIITTITANDLVTDADGNVYTYVTIGTQQWMVENFSSTKYADGTAIPYLNEVTGAELLTSWTNYPAASGFDTFISVGKDITLAINPDSGNGGCYSNTIAVPPTALRLTIDLTVNSGDVPNLRVAYTLGGGFYVDLAVLVAGVNTIDWTVPVGATNIYFYLQNLLVVPPPPYANVNCDFSAVCSVKELLLWQNDTTGAYCYYNNDIANKADYGVLYNWYAVDNAHGLAPVGWRVPSETDFETLTAFFGSGSEAQGALIGGGLLKEIGLTHWDSPNTGATDIYGFTLLPGGERLADGSFGLINERASLWGSDDLGSVAIAYQCLYDSAVLSSASGDYAKGFSVRMMRDI